MERKTTQRKMIYLTEEATFNQNLSEIKKKIRLYINSLKKIALM